MTVFELSGLTEYKPIRKLISLLRSYGQKVLDEVGLDEIKKMFASIRSKRGCPLKYDREKLFILVCEAISNGATNASAIARYAKKKVTRLCYWVTKSPSHDTISDFFSELSHIIEDLFYFLVKKAGEIGLIKSYNTKAIDTYPIETRFWSDLGAQWNPVPKSKQKTKGKWYWGYGAVVVSDTETHIPCGGRLCYSKKVDTYACMEVMGNTQDQINVDILLGDSEFDMNAFHEYCESRGTLLIAQYNPRKEKPKKPIKYRIQVRTMLPYEWLDIEYRQRVEVEHVGSTLKELYPLDNPKVKGYDKVKTWFFLMLSLRVIRGIAAFMDGKNPREVVEDLNE